MCARKETFLLLFLFLLNASHGKFFKTAITDFSQCKVHYSRTDRNYNMFFDLPQSTVKELAIDFHFYVLAVSDAHILLAPSAQVKLTDSVYEIVIGAGGNTFSDIRRKQKGSVRASFRQTGLLSAVDVTGFWIHIHKSGLIEVGKEGEKEAFLTWLDNDLISIKVVSFSTWDNVDAKWYFDCPRENPNKKVSPPTQIERLRGDILNISESHNDIVNITWQMLSQFISLDERRSILNLKGLANITWKFSPINWNPKNYGGIQSIVMQHGEIWKPELIITNAIDIDMLQPFSNNLLIAQYSGQVTWRPTFDIYTFCDMDGIEEWPNDVHTCEIDISTWLSQISSVRFQIDTFNENFLAANNFNSEWKIVELITETNEANINEQNANISSIVKEYLENQPLLKLRIKIRRNTNIYHQVFYALLLVICTLMLINFWSSPFESVKLSIVSAQFLLTTIATIGLATVLPAHREKIPYLVYRYSGLMIANIASLIITVIVINLSRNKQFFEPPHIIGRIIKSNFVEKLLFLPELTSKNVSAYPVVMETARRKILVQDVWIRLGTCIDRIAFIMFLLLTLSVLFAN